MALFGRGKDEEFEDDEEQIKDAERRDKKLGKKFKDLNPKNKRKRKEPPKPWGTKERVLVLSVLVITTVASGIFAFSARGKQLSSLTQLFSTFSISGLGNLFGEATIEIGQRGHFDTNDQKAREAINLFSQETKTSAGTYGFYVSRPSNNSSYGLGDTLEFQCKDLLKLPLLILLYKKSDEKSINLATRYILKNSDKEEGLGHLKDTKAGTVYTYKQLAEYMVKESDETAYKIIKNILGDTVFDDFIKSIGMESTDISTGYTTPADVGIVLDNLYQGKIVSEKSKEEIYTLLTDTSNENWIPKGVPKGVRVVHKFGVDNGNFSDAGIIFVGKPFVFVVMSKGLSQGDADKLFPAVSRDMYKIESGVK